MEYRCLGKTGIRVSVVAFGAGPVPSLMTQGEGDDVQRATVERAVELGINWFDTAATYGDGLSERNLGRALRDLGVSEQVHVATKVRIAPEEHRDLRGCVWRSCEASLARLGMQRVTLLQLHNSITEHRGDQPTSLTPADVLDRGGVLTAMRELQQSGCVVHLGLTGLGSPAALSEVIRSGAFATIQSPYNLLNPSAGTAVAADFPETNYEGHFAVCQQHQMGVFAIRVLAGGALAGQPPSEHTLRTKFFPLDLYQRDLRRAGELARQLPRGATLTEVAVRFVLAHPAVSSAIIGFSTSAQVDEIVRFALAGPGRE